MPYELSFTPEFFWGNSIHDYDDKGRPTCVWEALNQMSEHEDGSWEQLARNIFDTSGDLLYPSDVIQMIKETNTCSNIDTPVEVWIDPDGIYTVWVY